MAANPTAAPVAVTELNLAQVNGGTRGGGRARG